MHNGPQISNIGEWGDVTTLANNSGQIQYSCKYCSLLTRLKDKIENHIDDCKKQFLSLQENIDYVKCKICNLHAKSLGVHLKKIHKIDSDTYKKQYNSPAICSNAINSYSSASKEKGSWLQKAILNGDDLTEYKKKMSLSVSKSILSDHEECKRRSEFMKALNEKQQPTEEFKKIVSETAIKTSARKDIQEKRSLKLKEWRAKNPEDFYNKCVKKLCGYSRSKPEMKMKEFLQSLYDFKFKNNQFLKDNSFISKTNRKQIDFADMDKKIFVEYDGIFHFKPIKGQDCLDQIKRKDDLLNDFVMKNSYILIRVGMDQYVDKNKIEKSFFIPECLEQIKEILKINIPGVYKIGKVYE